MTDHPRALLFTVKATPRPQPRPRFVKGRVISTASRAVKFWRLMVEREARIAIGAGSREGVGYFSGPVLLTLHFFFETPRAERWGRPHAIRPDKDNLEKGVMDALQRAGVYADDCQVSDGPTSKTWADWAGCVVRVDPIIDAMADFPPIGGFGGNVRHQPTPDWLAGSGGVLRGARAKRSAPSGIAQAKGPRS